jgi:MFS family permease
MFVGADVIRGLIVSGVCVLYYLDALSFPMLLVAQILLSVCTAFFDPAIPTIIPQIVNRDQLTRANSQTQFVSGIATIIGPILGGLTVAWAGYLAVFIINAGSYLISAFFETFIRLPAPENAAGEDTGIITDIRAGYRYVYTRKSLVMILLMVGIIHFFVGSIEAIIPVLASNLSGDGAKNMGFIQTCVGLGTVLAAFIISFRNINNKETLFLFGSVFLIGVVLVGMSGLHLLGALNVFPFLAFFLAIGGLIIFAGTSFRSLLQKQVDDMLLGRVFGFVSSVGNISIPLAILIFGVLLEYISHNILLAASGFILMPISVFAYYKYTEAVSMQPQQESTA